jgi:hypothetical protein
MFSDEEDYRVLDAPDVIVVVTTNYLRIFYVSSKVTGLKAMFSSAPEGNSP